MKETIDIEDLLVWAYRDMQADKIAADKDWGVRLRVASSWHAVTHLGAYGTFVQTSQHELQPGDCDDAALIHKAVLDLDDAFLAVGENGDARVWDRALIAAEGGTVERLSGSRAVMRAASGEQLVLQTITVSVHLIIHARNASRPDCYADVARRRGRPRKDGEIAPGITYDDVVYHRAVYSVWHAALGVLAESLQGNLSRWAISGPKASDSPWLIPAPRVLEAVSSKYSAPSKPMKTRVKNTD